jgi:hypothetical protein
MLEELRLEELRIGRYVYDGVHWWKCYEEGRVMLFGEVEEVLNDIYPYIKVKRKKKKNA